MAKRTPEPPPSPPEEATPPEAGAADTGAPSADPQTAPPAPDASAPEPSAPDAEAPRVLGPDEARLSAPDGIVAASVAGTEYVVGDGHVIVPVAHVPHLQEHGFTRVA